MINALTSGFQEFAAENGYTDPEKFDEYLQEYLTTDNAQKILNTYADKIFNGVIENVGYLFRTDQQTCR